MKIAALSLPVIALVVVAATASADPPQAAPLREPATALPRVGCDAVLDAAIAEMKKPGNQSTVGAFSTVIVDDTAYAEAGPTSTGPGFVAPARGTAGPSGAGLSGLSQVGAVPSPTRYPLTFQIVKGAPGKATVKWTVRGRTFEGTVDSCTSRYWTASAAKSVIAIKFEQVMTVPQ